MQANFFSRIRNVFLISNFQIYWFGKKSVLEFLTNTEGTHETLETLRWPSEPIIFSIEHVQGQNPTEQLVKNF